MSLIMRRIFTVKNQVNFAQFIKRRTYINLISIPSFSFSKNERTFKNVKKNKERIINFKDENEKVEPENVEVKEQNESQESNVNFLYQLETDFLHTKNRDDHDKIESVVTNKLKNMNIIDCAKAFKLVRKILGRDISEEFYNHFNDRMLDLINSKSHGLKEADLLHSIVIFMDESTQYSHKVEFPIKAVDFILDNNFRSFEYDGILKLCYSLSYLSPYYFAKINKNIFKLMSELLYNSYEFKESLRFEKSTNLKKWIVDAQICYRGLYHAHSSVDGDNKIIECMELHEKSLLRYFTECKRFVDLETHTNLLSALTLNHLASDDKEKYSTLPHNPALLYLLFKTIVTLGKEEVFNCSNKHIFQTIYSFKRLLMHIKKRYPNSQKPEMIKFEKQIKIGFKLFTNVLIQNRFTTLSESDKIRILFESINLRVLNEDDLRNPEIIKYFKSIARERQDSEYYVGQNKFTKLQGLKPLDFFNVVGVLSSTIVFSVLCEYYGKEKEQSHLKLPQPSKDLINLYLSVIDQIDYMFEFK